MVIFTSHRGRPDSILCPRICVLHLTSFRSMRNSHPFSWCRRPYKSGSCMVWTLKIALFWLRLWKKAWEAGLAEQNYRLDAHIWNWSVIYVLVLGNSSGSSGSPVNAVQAPKTTQRSLPCDNLYREVGFDRTENNDVASKSSTVWLQFLTWSGKKSARSWKYIQFLTSNLAESRSSSRECFWNGWAPVFALPRRKTAARPFLPLRCATKQIHYQTFPDSLKPSHYIFAFLQQGLLSNCQTSVFFVSNSFSQAVAVASR
jgi:hypothetical protein